MTNSNEQPKARDLLMRAVQSGALQLERCLPLKPGLGCHVDGR